VALDLAGDGWARERGEVDAAGGVEAVDCLDQTDRPDLDQVVELRPLAHEAARDRPHEWEVVEDQPLACRAADGTRLRSR
jgi:hypothetical protein